MQISDPQTDSERELCLQAASGTHKAQAQARRALYDAHAGGVMTLAMRLLCERAAAEDVVQDTFLKAFEKLAGFSGRSRFGTWVRRIAINECLQRLRSPWHTRGQAYLETDAPQGSTDDQIDLLKALAQLDATSRTVVWLHDVEGYKHREIADLLGRTPSFSKSRLARAHATLRDLLDAAHDATHTASTTPNDTRTTSLCTPILKNS